ncbi:hypothetical protein ATX25_10005 [Oenococcus oeni]|nr:hypothetical protein ATX25_10005 [Oenococcus oeni]
MPKVAYPATPPITITAAKAVIPTFLPVDIFFFLAINFFSPSTLHSFHHSHFLLRLKLKEQVFHHLNPLLL